MNIYDRLTLITFAKGNDVLPGIHKVHEFYSFKISNNLGTFIPLMAVCSLLRFNHVFKLTVPSLSSFGVLFH